MTWEQESPGIGEGWLYTELNANVSRGSDPKKDL